MRVAAMECDDAPESGFEKPVLVGESKYVHIRSAFYHDETRCGLTHNAQTYFRDTTDKPTCPYCISARSA